MTYLRSEGPLDTNFAMQSAMITRATIIVPQNMPGSVTRCMTEYLEWVVPVTRA